MQERNCFSGCEAVAVRSLTCQSCRLTSVAKKVPPHIPIDQLQAARGGELSAPIIRCRDSDFFFLFVQRVSCHFAYYFQPQFFFTHFQPSVLNFSSPSYTVIPKSSNFPLFGNPFWNSVKKSGNLSLYSLPGDEISRYFSCKFSKKKPSFQNWL